MAIETHSRARVDWHLAGPTIAFALALAALGLAVGELPTAPMAMTHYGEQVMGHLSRVLVMMGVVFVLAYGALFTTPWSSTAAGAERNARWNPRLCLALFAYFTALVIYQLVVTVVPTTADGGWRGWPDAAIFAIWLGAWLPIAAVAGAVVGAWAPAVDTLKRLVVVLVVMLHLAMLGMASATTWGQPPPPMMH